jgi:alpha-mannosidase
MQLTATAIRDFGGLIEVKQQYSYKNSRLEQTIVLHKQDPIIRIYHEVDWKDTGYMLRSETLPSVWSDVVHSDIQFGYLDRPTTENTEHEVAQHEMCALKWFDVSGEKQGFAVLNNTKDGYMAIRGILSLNLLRSTNYPCVDSEHKHIQYSYAFYPHMGGFDPVKTDAIAGDFNARYLYGETRVEIPTVDVDEVVVAAFKPAYDGNGYILRLYERAGKPANANLRLPDGYRMIGEVNLLEDEIGEGATKLSFKPFEIRSFRIWG